MKVIVAVEDSRNRLPFPELVIEQVIKLNTNCDCRKTVAIDRWLSLSPLYINDCQAIEKYL